MLEHYSYLSILALTNKNILNLWGYKGTIIKGLLLSTLGAFQWYLLVNGGGFRSI